MKINLKEKSTQMFDFNFVQNHDSKMQFYLFPEVDMCCLK